jgi:abortive infection bacteriophage resistance protein
MNKIEYIKIPTSYEDQIALLKQRGLLIPDDGKALRYLQQISYFRLSAYFLPYQNIKDRFNEGVDFDQILDTYRFDRELRLLVFDCIERIEVAIRSQITQILAHNYNSSHWQDNPLVFLPPYKDNRTGLMTSPYSDLQQIIQKSCTAKHPEVFIKHYKEKYSTPTNPPSWMCMELLTIGELSRLYMGLKHNKDKNEIAKFFGLHQTVFTSWLHTLAYVRNICAHHARLWNREFAIKPEILLKPKNEWIDTEYNNNKRTFYFLCTLKYLLWEANSYNSFTTKLEALFAKYPNVPIKFLGIPSNGAGSILEWQEEPLWR